MQTQITWLIEAMLCKLQDGQLTNVVETVFWRCNGVFADTYGTCYGQVTVPSPDPANFVDYHQLTEDQVLNWCWSNGVDKNQVEFLVDQQIKDQIAPPIIKPVALPLPW